MKENGNSSYEDLYDIAKVKKENQIDEDENFTIIKEEIETNVEYIDTVTTIKKEIQIDVECSVDFSSAEVFRGNCYQYPKIEAVDDKEKLHSSLPLVRIEKDEIKFNQNVKQETKTKNTYFNNEADTPDSLSNDHNFKAKSGNFGANKDDEIKLNQDKSKQGLSNRFSKDKNKMKFEVVRKTNSGASTVLFKSSVCPYTTFDKYKIKKHIGTHEKNRIYNCLDCEFTANCLFALKFHKQTHTENSVLCPICPFVTKSNTTLKKHKFTQHRNRNPKSCSSRSSKRLVKFEETFKCNVCSFMTNEDKYEEYMKIHFINKAKTNEVKVLEALSVSKGSKSSEHQGTSKKKYKILHHCGTHRKNKTFNCLHCHFTTNRLLDLKLHKQTHMDKILCPVCPVETKLKSILQKYTSKSTKYKNSKCCSYIDSKLTKKSVKSRETFKCDICSFTTKNIKILVKKMLVCPICSFITCSMSKLAEHKKNNCKFSEHRKIDISSFRDPSKEKIEYLSPQLFSCKSCSFTSSLKIALLKHKQLHMSSETGFLNCTECKFSTKKNKLLVSHLMNHAYQYLYRCRYCNFSSNAKGALKSHKGSHMNPQIRTNFRLYIGKKLKVIPKTGQLFKCYRCDYSCSTGHLLNQHSLIHSEKKRLKCAHCDYETHFKGNIVKHVFTHVGEYFTK